MNVFRLRSAFLIALGALGTGACNVEKFAADQMAEVAEAGAKGFNGFWDFEIFGAAVPSAIVQSEGMIAISPDNEKLLLGTARTYVSYAYGWLSDEWELADERGDFERADELENRIMHIYRRAAALGLRATRMHDGPGKLDEVIKAHDLAALKDYLAKNFTDKDDVGPLYWAGLGWGSAIANSGGDVNQVADAPLARALLERSVELDPSYADAGALGVLGTVEASFPELFGGSLEKAKALYDRALEVCQRRNHLILLSYAKVYAVAKQDRSLFLSLIHEILDAKDLGPEIRMSNKVARHRAKRYLKRVDQWFDPAMQPVPEGAPEPEPAPVAAQ
jgi:tetratricopeptide (TPR) repeat protein